MTETTQDAELAACCCSAPQRRAERPPRRTPKEKEAALADYDFLPSDARLLRPLEAVKSAGRALVSSGGGFVERRRKLKSAHKQAALSLLLLLLLGAALSQQLEAKIHHSKRQVNGDSSNQQQQQQQPSGRESTNWWNLWWQQYISEAQQPTVRPIVAVSLEGRQVRLADDEQRVGRQAETLGDANEANQLELERNTLLQLPNNMHPAAKQQVLQQKQQHLEHWQLIGPHLMRDVARANRQAAPAQPQYQVDESASPNDEETLGIQMRASAGRQAAPPAKPSVQRQQQQLSANQLAMQQQQQQALDELRFEQQQQNQMADYSEEAGANDELEAPARQQAQNNAQAPKEQAFGADQGSGSDSASMMAGDAQPAAELGRRPKVAVGSGAPAASTQADAGKARQMIVSTGERQKSADKEAAKTQDGDELRGQQQQQQQPAKGRATSVQTTPAGTTTMTLNTQRPNQVQSERTGGTSAPPGATSNARVEPTEPSNTNETPITVSEPREEQANGDSPPASTVSRRPPATPTTSTAGTTPSGRVELENGRPSGMRSTNAARLPTTATSTTTTTTTTTTTSAPTKTTTPSIDSTATPNSSTKTTGFSTAAPISSTTTSFISSTTRDQTTEAGGQQASSQSAASDTSRGVTISSTNAASGSQAAQSTQAPIAVSTQTTTTESSNTTESGAAEDSTDESGDEEEGETTTLPQGGLMNNAGASGDDSDEAADDETTTTTTTDGATESSSSTSEQQQESAQTTTQPPSKSRPSTPGGATSTTTQQPALTTIDIERLPTKTQQQQQQPAASMSMMRTETANSEAPSRKQAAKSGGLVTITLDASRANQMEGDTAIAMPMEALMKMIMMNQTPAQPSSTSFSEAAAGSTTVAPSSEPVASTQKTASTATTKTSSSSIEATSSSTTQAPLQTGGLSTPGVDLEEGVSTNGQQMAKKMKMLQPPPPTTRQPASSVGRASANQQQQQQPGSQATNSEGGRMSSVASLEPSQSGGSGAEMELPSGGGEGKIELLNLDLMPIQRIMSTQMNMGERNAQQTNATQVSNNSRQQQQPQQQQQPRPADQVLTLEVEPGMRLRPPNQPLNPTNTVYMMVPGNAQMPTKAHSKKPVGGPSFEMATPTLGMAQRPSSPASIMMMQRQQAQQAQPSTQQPTTLSTGAPKSSGQRERAQNSTPAQLQTAPQQTMSTQTVQQAGRSRQQQPTTPPSTFGQPTATSTSARPRFSDGVSVMMMMKQRAGAESMLMRRPLSELNGVELSSTRAPLFGGEQPQSSTSAATQSSSGAQQTRLAATTSTQSPLQTTRLRQQQATTLITSTVAPSRAQQAQQATTNQRQEFTTTTTTSTPTVATQATVNKQASSEAPTKISGEPVESTTAASGNPQEQLARLQQADSKESQPALSGAAEKRPQQQQQQPGVASKSGGQKGAPLESGKATNSTGASFIPTKLRSDFNKFNNRLQAEPALSQQRLASSIRQFGGANRMSALSEQPVPFGRPGVSRAQQARPLDLALEYGAAIAVRRPDEPLANGQMPNCTLTGKNFCVLTKDYPMNEVRQAVERSFRSVRIMYEELQTVSDQELHRADLNLTGAAKEAASGKFACQTQVEMMRPGWAKDEISKEWMLVVNTDVFPQRVRTESCAQPNTPCEFIAPFYDSTCQQRFSLHRMIAIDPHDPARSPQVAVFKFPAGCVCRVHPIRKTTLAQSTTPAAVTSISSSTSKSIRRRR